MTGFKVLIVGFWLSRHLLSDQTDPFNRSPLTLDQVIPNKELAEEIRKWISERKASSK